jgi:hypothetical protein
MTSQQGGERQPAGSRVVLAIRPDPVLVSADSDPAALAAVEDA